jgi:tetratricopeptide (TPR) repeat protein
MHWLNGVQRNREHTAVTNIKTRASVGRLGRKLTVFSPFLSQGSSITGRTDVYKNAELTDSNCQIVLEIANSTHAVQTLRPQRTHDKNPQTSLAEPQADAEPPSFHFSCISDCKESTFVQHDNMQTDADLPTLIKQSDHLNALRYIRIHQLREPELVVRHGKALLGTDLSRGLSDEVARLAVLEQVCLGALDAHDPGTAEVCLDKLKAAGIAKESTRFRRLLARCLEGAEDYAGAEIIYDDLLKESPANLQALKRKYCMLKAQVGKEVESMEALNVYLKQVYADSGAWYEMARLRKELGDFKGAAFALEEVILGVPSDAKMHVELAECYATIGGMENLLSARKHMAQALELDATDRRAQFGLVSVANAYLEEAASAGKKSVDEYEIQVAKELVRYGSEQVLSSYEGSDMFQAVKTLMTEYTADL